MTQNELTSEDGTARGAPVRVLLVEDHAFVRELMATLLERQAGRYRVVAEAATASEAIAACRRLSARETRSAGARLEPG